MMTQKKTLFPCSLLVVLVLTGIASAKQDDGKFLDDLKPVLDCQTIALVHIQLSDLSIKESCEQLVEVIEKLPEKNKAASLQQAAFMEQSLCRRIENERGQEVPRGISHRRILFREATRKPGVARLGRSLQQDTASR